eukprot:scaffold120694_cov35-Tisochrysis_lutea.AAC.3
MVSSKNAAPPQLQALEMSAHLHFHSTVGPAMPEAANPWLGHCRRAGVAPAPAIVQNMHVRGPIMMLCWVSWTARGDCVPFVKA